MPELNLNKNAKLYFMGIGGTGMASAAGLMKELGYQVTGSDQQLYPPMSDMLERLDINVQCPYPSGKLVAEQPAAVIVANCLSESHPFVRELLESKLPYTSFPGLLEQTVLQGSGNIVVAGTHGKTTTSSLLSWSLESLSLQPGYFIGGLPGNFSNSFRARKGHYFVIEGDEYDSAFFDKKSKFLHYNPEYLLLNHIEFDHADIFEDDSAVEAAFEQLVLKVPESGKIIANLSDPGVRKLLFRLDLPKKQIVGVYPLMKENPDVDEHSLTTKLISFSYDQKKQLWQGRILHQKIGLIDFSSQIGGPHNMINICQTIGTLGELAAQGSIPYEGLNLRIADALKTFKGVRRRLDFLGSFGGIEIYEDFAHHPTAVRQVIRSMRQARPESRLVLAFDPANASSRRNIFMPYYSEVFQAADRVFLGPPKEDLRIPVESRMDIGKLAQMSGAHVTPCCHHDTLAEMLINQLKPGDVVLLLSSGSFAGLAKTLTKELSGRQKKCHDLPNNAVEHHF
ncbi:MAG: UDP-N-acetylmuramate:L-alanyl-gamma-D-glutamyl-meso-diaminopimelate ligase [Deltaproteobacteria bacterium]|nr:UDP-N-acetylmuramate:L-alanyl-gamma-D-glutamyl-meso-diaminopimelate ligase [Deltaproteobacteria bacterium]